MAAKTFEKVLSQERKHRRRRRRSSIPRNPDTVYATLWEARQGPWENGAWNGTGGGIFKSTDGGTTWQQLAGGLPEGIVQAYVAIAPSDPKRLYASVAYQGNASTSTAPTMPAPPGPSPPLTRVPPAASAAATCLSHASIPKNPDIVYMTRTVTWKSTDGGKTWTGFRGAPGGDDYQNIWINPNNPNIILLASDQGAIITVNGGETWSSWYNQPTAQMYHVNADNAFPYRVCSGQQESGSACISSRGNDGEITFREWHPVASKNTATSRPIRSIPTSSTAARSRATIAAPGRRRTSCRWLLRTPDFRVLRTEPVVFSPVDPHVLYFAANTLWTHSRRRPKLEADQSRPHPQDLGRARQRRHLRRADSQAHPARRDLRAWLLRRSTSTASGPAPTMACI